jgi:immune inhibitor A
VHQPRRAAAKRRLLPAVPVLALVVAGLSVSGASGPAGAAADSHPTYTPTAKDYYINYVDPKVEDASAGAEALGKGGAKKAGTPAKEYGRKFTEGNPMAGRGLAKVEREAVRTGKNPRQIRYKRADETQVASC